MSAVNGLIMTMVNMVVLSSDQHVIMIMPTVDAVDAVNTVFSQTETHMWMLSIIDFPSLGITYNGGWCSATKTR